MRRLRLDDHAVSVVIGAILVAAILFAALVFFRLSYVPHWEERTEAAHMSLIERELTGLRAELDAQVINGSAGQITHPLTLGRPGFSPLIPLSSNHQVGFTPQDKWFNVSSSEMLVTHQDGRSLVGANEVWRPLSGNTSLTSVSSLEHLRLRLTSLSSADDGDQVVLTLVDADGQWAGEMRISVVAQPVGFDLRARVLDAQGTTLHDQPVASGLQGTHAPYWLDPLASGLPLRHALAAATAPYELHMETSGLDVHYAAAYRQSVSGGSILAGGTGVPTPSWNAGHHGGTLLFEGRNARFVDQTFILENGALILDQGGDSVMLVPPVFHAARVGTAVSLTVSLPSLAGDAGSIAGASLVGLSTNTLQQAALEGSAPDLTMSVQTRHAGLWADLWRDRLDAVPGLVEGMHYDITTTASQATLTLDGFGGATERDIHLRLVQATILVGVDT